MRCYPFLLRVLPFVIVFGILQFAGAAASRTWYVKPNGTGDVPTIQAGVDSAAPGDVILLAPGRYTWANQGGGSGYGMVFVARGQDDFTIRGEMGAGRTVLDAQGQGRVLFIQGFNDIVVEGLTITGGVAPATGNFGGGGVENHLSGDIIRDCIFEYNTAQQGGAIWCGGVSHLRIENCTFRYNSAFVGGAILFVNSTTSQTITDCTFYENTAETRGGALYALNNGVAIESSVFSRNASDVDLGGALYLREMYPSSISGCTFVQNVAPGGAAVSLIASPEITMEKCVVAYQLGSAFASVSGGVLTLSCSDVYANTSDALPAGWIDGGGNFALDPGFCGVLGSEDYHLESTSPCLAGNHPGGAACGQIGAFGAGCPGVSVEARSWGSVKALYR
jgi:predicted outer membrane repeat protein